MYRRDEEVPSSEGQDFCSGARLTRRRRFWVIIVVLLYAVTWVGGYCSYSRKLQASTVAACQEAAADNKQRTEMAEAEGFPLRLIELHQRGPTSSVWCVPLLPCVLWADWSYDVAKGYGAGGGALVFYYGVGCLDWRFTTRRE